MITLDISSFSEGSSVEKRTVDFEEMDRGAQEEFPNEIELLFEINKVGHEYFIKTHLQTQARLTCDRCLELFDFDIDDSVNIIFTSNTGLYTETEDDVYAITDSSKQINVADSVWQALQITIPYKHVCSPDCKGLCSHCGTNLNTGTCDCSGSKVDPRWEALKNIKFNS